MLSRGRRIDNFQIKEHYYNQATNYLSDGGEADVSNCGYGQGCPVRQVAYATKKVIEVDFPAEYALRMPGDSYSACGR